MSADRLASLHYEIVRGFLNEGHCPSNPELASRLKVNESEVRDGLKELAGIHGVVLHPHVCEPWVVHPFSCAPTANWVQAGDRGWWAPCIWCALGVATLAGGDVTIHSRMAGQFEPVAIAVTDGEPRTHRDLQVHFAIRPADAWANVHFHCALVLPFASTSEIDAWCVRHRLQRGEAVPLTQVADLARVWYGCHADPDWRKWTIAEAQAIFDRVGLRSEFWSLGASVGQF